MSDSFTHDTVDINQILFKLLQFIFKECSIYAKNLNTYFYFVKVVLELLYLAMIDSLRQQFHPGMR